MNILYGVCGEGFGHSSRAKTLISRLEKSGNNVLVITYGQAHAVLKSLFKTLKIKGVHLFFKENKLLLQKTSLEATKSLFENLRNYKKIKKAIEDFSPDICITDMEPITALISYYYKLPLISLDNQHRLTHLKINIPKKHIKDYLIAKQAISLCVPKADFFIILSFKKQKVKSENTEIVSPILRKEILSLKPRYKNFVLVYLTKENSEIISLLKQINEKFVIYGYNKSLKIKNIYFRKFGKSFLKDLASCKAVIASSGFSLMSEAVYLKKPYFAIPLQGQFEQTLNALFLKKEKLGDFSEKPSKEEIVFFLKKIPLYKKALLKNKFDPNEAISIIDKELKEVSNIS